MGVKANICFENAEQAKEVKLDKQNLRLNSREIFIQHYTPRSGIVKSDKNVRKYLAKMTKFGSFNRVEIANSQSSPVAPVEDSDELFPDMVPEQKQQKFQFSNEVPRNIKQFTTEYSIR